LQKQILRLQKTTPGLLALSWAPFARSFYCPSDGGSFDGVSGITPFYRQQTVRRRERFEKAELHAEDAPQIPPTELEGSYPDPVPEMSANEIAAQEMLSSELRSPVEMPERQK
ncbi:hypothetical protein GQ607_013769, partial [Colletotrichum asianum]